jgi:protein-tyrosine phosphatase
MQREIGTGTFWPRPRRRRVADAVRDRIVVGAGRRLQAPAERIIGAPRIRRALHRRALRAWRSTDTPLILCHGNINRSPFAAMLARLQQAKSPTSAGFYGAIGRSTPEPTLVRAAEYGADLSTHRSNTVEAGQLDRAPAIFVFDFVNLAAIACRRPRALGRTHLLGMLSATDGAFIPDPWGQPPEVLDRVLQRISQAISAAAAH